MDPKDMTLDELIKRDRKQGKGGRGGRGGRGRGGRDDTVGRMKTRGAGIFKRRDFEGRPERGGRGRGGPHKPMVSHFP